MDPQNVLIHVRFAPNGTVVEIGERPQALSPQEWFNDLSDRVGSTYQVFSGGRGVFRLARGALDAIKAESTPSIA
ncbi:MAG TPA: hypothetical protein VIQ29_16215 [Ancylobacter sp.]